MKSNIPQEAIEHIVRRFLTDVMGHETDEFSGYSKLQEDLGLDSLDMIDMLHHVEKELNVTVDDSKYYNVYRTVQGAIEYIQQHIK